MMTVLEYAEDMNKSVEDVLAKCKVLGILANNQEDMLDDEAIVILDNAWDEDLEATEEVLADIEFEEQVEELVENTVLKIKEAPTKQKIVTKDKKNIATLKKEMYKNKNKLASNVAKADENQLIYKEGMTLADLANEIGVGAAELIKKLMVLGNMANQNQPLSLEEAELLAGEYGKTIKAAEKVDIASFESFEIVDQPEDLLPRPPVVTIMGHVDHGKTTLLDTIRKTNVVACEAGGITQHIAAYQIKVNGEKITFIDTPGHAAFTEMRARGASVTDIIIIIVAADDGIMPQTKEVIDHAKAAGVPIIVAINKIDKEGANPERIMQEMSEYGLTPDIWGGDTLFAKISAKHNQGIDELLQSITLIAQMQELKANPNRYATGTVIEARQDKASGNIVTLLVQSGTLRLGDPIVIGEACGKVRTMRNDACEEIVAATPSSPVEITGISEIPKAGDRFMAFETDKEAKNIASLRKAGSKTKKFSEHKPLSLDDVFANIKDGLKEINIILKTDVNGTEEAIKNSLAKLNVDGVKINIIRSGVGTISESDVVLANASNAIILGFNVRPGNNIKDLAKEYGVDVRLYNIIYQLIEEVERAMEGLLDPVYEEKILGTAEVRQLFKFSKIGVIAGCYVTDGIVKNRAKARIIRDGMVINDVNIASIQREKDQAKEVKKGLECGITLEKYDDIKEGDIIEVYEMVEVVKK